MKVVIKKYLFLIFCLTCISILQGCNGTSAPASKTVGIAMPTKNLERWNRDGDYLKTLFEKEGYEVDGYCIPKYAK